MNDKREGQGVYDWPDGRQYDGGWLDGKQQGRGIYSLSDGMIKVGNWEKGKRTHWILDENQA